MGTAPIRIEPFIADIVWKTNTSRNKIYELDPTSGRRVRELPPIRHEDRVYFKFDESSPTIYYEFTAKEYESL